MQDEHMLTSDPTPSDIAIARGIAQAQEALAEAIKKASDGDNGAYWFVSQLRVQAMDKELRAMRQVFWDLYGAAVWDTAVK